MTTKELMIGDIIGVTHEELGLVYAKVEYINETGDLMVRADNDYMNGGYECTDGYGEYTYIERHTKYSESKGKL